jgi:hypothetical protein
LDWYRCAILATGVVVGGFVGWAYTVAEDRTTITPSDSERTAPGDLGLNRIIDDEDQEFERTLGEGERFRSMDQRELERLWWTWLRMPRRPVLPSDGNALLRIARERGSYSEQRVLGELRASSDQLRAARGLAGLLEPVSVLRLEARVEEVEALLGEPVLVVRLTLLRDESEQPDPILLRDVAHRLGTTVGSRLGSLMRTFVFAPGSELTRAGDAHVLLVEI